MSVKMALPKTFVLITILEQAQGDVGEGKFLIASFHFLFYLFVWMICVFTVGTHFNGIHKHWYRRVSGQIV